MNPGRGVITLLAGVALLGGAALAQAPGQLKSSMLSVSFEAVPGLEYSTQGPSTLTAITGAGRLSVVLGGPPNPHDADYWKTLDPARLILKLPPGQQTVLLRAELFVCDKNMGLCSVQRQERRVTVIAGEPLRLSWAAPKLLARP